jgi:hypothetical protein
MGVIVVGCLVVCAYYCVAPGEQCAITSNGAGKLFASGGPPAFDYTTSVCTILML